MDKAQGKIRQSIVNLATGILIICGKLKTEDLDDIDKERFEEICQLTNKNLMKLFANYRKITDRPEREKIIKWLAQYDTNFEKGTLPCISETVAQILALFPDKITGKPPLLSDREVADWLYGKPLDKDFELLKREAQRESDWEWFKGGCNASTK